MEILLEVATQGLVGRSNKGAPTSPSSEVWGLQKKEKQLLRVEFLLLVFKRIKALQTSNSNNHPLGRRVFPLPFEPRTPAWI